MKKIIITLLMIMFMMININSLVDAIKKNNISAIYGWICALLLSIMLFEKL